MAIKECVTNLTVTDGEKPVRNMGVEIVDFAVNVQCVV